MNYHNREVSEHPYIIEHAKNTLKAIVKGVAIISLIVALAIIINSI